MTVQFPTGLDSLPDTMKATTATVGGATDHATVHAQLADVLAAVMAKVGVDRTTVATALDYVCFWHPVTRTASTAANAWDWVLANAASGAVTITGNTPARPGAIIRLKKTDTTSNAVTFTPASGTVDGASSLSITTPYQTVDLGWDGTNWWAA